MKDAAGLNAVDDIAVGNRKLRTVANDFIPGAYEHSCVKSLGISFTRPMLIHLDTLVPLSNFQGGLIKSARQKREVEITLDVSRDSIFSDDNLYVTLNDSVQSHCTLCTKSYEKPCDALRFCPANVNTLKPKEFSNTVHDTVVITTSRIASLDHSFNEAGVQVLGIQISRIQGDLHFSTEHYDVRASVADTKGCCGVQLWTRKDLVRYIRAFLPLSPRLLIAVMEYNNFEIVIVVGHAPHEEAQGHFLGSTSVRTGSNDEQTSGLQGRTLG